MREKLDFEENKVQLLSLEELKMTHREDDQNGRPMKGAYHFEVIEQASDIMRDAGLAMEIAEIFAANNKDKYQAGVTRLRNVEEQYGEKAIQAHILRRVFSNIVIHDLDNEEYSTQMAIAFHQSGIQVGFGNMVKICHNQCLLCPDSVAQTNGQNAMSLGSVFERIKQWAENFKDIVIPEREMLQRMRERIISPTELVNIIGELTAERVAHDTTIKEIRVSGTYPLNQTQIGKFTESLLLTNKRNDRVTLYDVYNAATDLYKADAMEIPNIMPQHVELVKFVKNYL